MSTSMSTMLSVVTRAAIDVGSGDTKITVADVDLKNYQIINIWHKSVTAVELRKDLTTSIDGCLSKEIEQKLIRTIQAMQEEGMQFSPTQWTAVGTSVFRTANNGEEFLARVKAATGMDIRIVPQIEEGEVGFASAVAASREDQEGIIAWDSGSGSFQLTTLINGKLEMYGAEFGFVPALKALFDYRKQPFHIGLSPNPVSSKEAMELIDTICKKLPPVSSWMVNNNKKIISFGGITSIFSVGKIATGNSSFTREEVMAAILQFSGTKDEQLSQFRRPHETMIALILLYAVMKQCGIEKVAYFTANGNCEGLLISPRYW
jgi:exopolyphosphatase / guanosine-5'-triphosphate,3'-diphosphate pyrophosphatase